jgi:hypothetical protein
MRRDSWGRKKNDGHCCDELEGISEKTSIPSEKTSEKASEKILATTKPRSLPRRPPLPPLPPRRKRTRAEAIVNSIAKTASEIDDLDFPSFSTEDRTMIIDAMNSLKETLDEAIPRAVKNQKKAT